jgi:putative SOS response-associated peptidase YedK
MCGRYTLISPDDVLDELGVAPPAGLRPRYNVAPTDEMPVVLVREGARVCELHRWGLIPSWAESPKVGAKMINARAETAATRPAFRSAMARRRCLVAADGFYEWRREGKKRFPYWIHRADRKALSFAGLWETWKPPEDEGADWLLSFTILTGAANSLVGEIHDRMPIAIAAADRERWLEPELGVDGIEDLLVPPPVDELEMTAVSTRVNKVANDDPSCLEPADVQGDLF